LLHGAWHGPWCWKQVVDGLAARGIAAVVPELPLTTLAADADVIRDALDEARALTDSRLIVCAHSYAGVPLAEALDDPTMIDAIVYVSAMVPKAGDSVASIIGDARSLLREGIDLSEDELQYTLDPERIAEALYNDLPVAAHRRIARANVLRPQAVATFFTEVSRDAPAVASLYVRCMADNTIDQSVQQQMSSRCDDSVQWATSHSPFLSQPDLLTNLLSDTITSKHQLT